MNTYMKNIIGIGIISIAFLAGAQNVLAFGLPDIGRPTIPRFEDNFDHLPGDPIVNTKAPKNLSWEGVTLEGYVNPKGVTDTESYFEWGTSRSFGKRTDKTYIPVASTVEERLVLADGLQPNVTYYYRLVAKNVLFKENGDVHTFMLPAAPIAPIVRTDPATNIATSSATLNGFADPKGNAGSVWYFEWGGTQGNLNHKTAETAFSTVTNPQFSLIGLSSCNDYFFRLVVKNANDTYRGSILSFKTTGCVIPTQLSVTCQANLSAPKVGQVVTWSASATGGTGSYAYSWTGTDSLSGNQSTVTKTYSATGRKEATIQVTAGGESVTRVCSVEVTQDPGPTTLDGFCTPSPTSALIGSVISWNATASGGTGAYSYTWSGSEGLTSTSTSVSKGYFTVGTMQATVIISSGNQSVTRSCSAVIYMPSGGGSSVGGGIDPPSVSLRDTQKVPAGNLASAYVYLSQVPYTGPEDYIAMLVFFAVAIVVSGMGAGAWVYFSQKKA